MAEYQWSDELSVGDPGIDDEHKTLLDLVEKLRAATRSGQGRDEVGQLLDELVSYTVTHFAHEESHMREIDYPDYPQHKAKEYPVLLPSIEDSQDFVVSKLQELSRLWDAPEDKLPDCTDKELWRSDPQFKYYSDPEKAKDPSARSTKNFDSLAEAEAFKREKGKGVVITKLGEVKACNYCPAFEVCKQRNQYFAEGN